MNFDYDRSYSEAEEEEPRAVEAVFEGEAMLGYINGASETPDFIGDAASLDPANFELDEIVSADNLTEDEEIAARLDVSFATLFGDYPGQWKFGGKLRQRVKFNDEMEIVYEGFGADFNLNPCLNTNIDWGLGNFGPTINMPSVLDFLNQSGAGFEVDEGATREATYRDDYLDSIEELDDPAFDRYADAHTQLDLSAKYWGNDNFQVYLEAINVNDEPFYAYFDDPRYNSQYEEYGWTAQVGLRASF